MPRSFLARRRLVVRRGEGLRPFAIGANFSPPMRPVSLPQRGSCCVRGGVCSATIQSTVSARGLGFGCLVLFLLIGCGPGTAVSLEESLADCLPQGDLVDDALLLVDGPGQQVLGSLPFLAPQTVRTPELVAEELSAAHGQASFVGDLDSDLWPFLVQGPNTQGEAETFITDRSGRVVLHASIAWDGEGSIFTPAEWGRPEVFKPYLRRPVVTPTCSRTAEPGVAVVPVGTSQKASAWGYAAVTTLSRAVSSDARRNSAVIFGIRTGVPALYSTFWLFTSRRQL